MRPGVALIVVVLLVIGVAIYGFAQQNQQQTSSVSSASSSPARLPQPSLAPITPANLPLNIGQGLKLGYFAKGLDGGARDLQFSPGGVLLVSIPSSGEVGAMPDKNNSGHATQMVIVLSGLNHPHGLAFFGGKLYVAEVDRVVRYNWDEQNLKATEEKVLFSLPENNDHNARTLIFDPSGNLYVSVGSTCNVCHEDNSFSGTVIISNSNGDNPRIFASGLRNAPFLQFNPRSGDLWATEMGRDYLGENIPPDEINILKNGQNYGWPNCYGNKVPDTQFNPSASSGINCQQSVAPIYQIQAHSAPLGLVFINSPQFPADWQGDLLVAYHGSWNRSVPTGYKVVHMKVLGNQISGEEDFLTGFQNGQIGRPVDMTFDKAGNLYLSDDKSDAVYIIGKR
jgi:glucose/arabinose dehydrogenase